MKIVAVTRAPGDVRPLPRWLRQAIAASAAPVPIRTVPAPTLARRVRGYAAAGLLAMPARRRHRRDICAACPHAVATPHRGLYTCGSRRAAGCGCAGAPVLRLALAATTCPLARW